MTLSCFILQYQILQVDPRNWVDDLQKIMKQVGLDQKPSVFLFSDTQAKVEQNYEDISNILNNGEVPNLFNTEDRLKIIDEISNFMPIGTANEKFNYFVSKCKEHLHLMLFMSPVGENFRRRIRMFPGIVNCTTIDWFLSWPNEALV